MKKLFLFAATVATFTFSLISCNKNGNIVDPVPTMQKAHVNGDEPEGEMILGARLENSYSVANMQAAYDSLIANGDIKFLQL
ncbi:MAG: hypothetical protein LBS50_01935 [Prevotellaceae bacterium]|jgi:hypothetical protein|nr:hypothetical protein [Prevotellaceae bacterium]